MTRWLFIAAMVPALLIGSLAHAGEPRHANQVVYQERSLYRNILVLEGRSGFRCMTFGRFHGEQSCVQVGHPERLVLSYTRGLMVGAMALAEPKRVLVVGLGGGVMPMALRRLFPQAQIDAVELDPAVVRVAKDWFGYREDARSRAVVNDGRVFIRWQRRAGVRYDLILLDAFEKDYIPEHMLTREFLQEVRDVLEPEGVLVANTFATGVLRDYEASTYRSVFGATYELEVESGNRMVMAARGALPSLAAMQDRGTALAVQLGPLGVEPKSVLGLVRRGGDGSERVQPLTDQFSPSNLLLAVRSGVRRR